MKRQWYVIPSFPGYEISVDGAKEGEIRRGNVNESKYTHCTYPGRLRKLYQNRQGYFNIRLSKDGKHYLRFVHCLIAEVFLGPKPSGMEVNHKDLDKGNNRPSNLEYVTKKENARHAWANGAVVLDIGEGSHCNKLTWMQVHEIRALYEDGCSLGKLALTYKVTPGTIAHIVHWRTWCAKVA